MTSLPVSHSPCLSLHPSPATPLPATSPHLSPLQLQPRLLDIRTVLFQILNISLLDNVWAGARWRLTRTGGEGGEVEEGELSRVWRLSLVGSRRMVGPAETTDSNLEQTFSKHLNSPDTFDDPPHFPSMSPDSYFVKKRTVRELIQVKNREMSSTKRSVLTALRLEGQMTKSLMSCSFFSSCLASSGSHRPLSNDPLMFSSNLDPELQSIELLSTLFSDLFLQTL